VFVAYSSSGTPATLSGKFRGFLPWRTVCLAGASAAGSTAKPVAASTRARRKRAGRMRW
jgi:hypothetical protein